MPNDREKLLKIMSNLESDYRSGKISAEKYSYFRSKYEDKLNTLDAETATMKIRSMQGKPSFDDKKRSSRKRKSRSARNKRREEQDLVQKYIVEPKKGDKTYGKKSSGSDGTFKLIVLLILVVGFTAGVAYGVFTFDSEPVTDAGVVATVHDTAFPAIKEVIKPNKTQTNNTVTVNVTETTVDSEPTQDTQTETQTQTQTDTQDQSQPQEQSQSQDQSSDQSQDQSSDQSQQQDTNQEG